MRPARWLHGLSGWIWVSPSLVGPGRLTKVAACVIDLIVIRTNVRKLGKINRKLRPPPHTHTACFTPTSLPQVEGEKKKLRERKNRFAAKLDDA